MKTTIRLSTTLTAIIILTSCCAEYHSDDVYLTAPADSYSTLRMEGWDCFENGDFPHAIDAFREALERDAAKPESHLGLGWSYARNRQLNLAETSLGSALIFASFDTAQADVIITEAYAGLAVVAAAAQNYESVVVRTDSVLSRDPDFVFTHDSQFTDYELRLLNGEANFRLGRITEAYLQALALGATFSEVAADTSSGTAAPDEETAVTGACRVTIANADHALIHVSSVRDTVLGIYYDILDVHEGTAVLVVEGNPPLAKGQTVEVVYTYVYDYGAFINNLISTLIALKV